MSDLEERVAKAMALCQRYIDSYDPGEWAGGQASAAESVLDILKGE